MEANTSKTMAYTKQAMQIIAKQYDCEIDFETNTNISKNGFIWKAYQDRLDGPIAFGHAIRYSPQDGRYPTIKQCKTLSLMLSIATGMEAINLGYHTEPAAFLRALATKCSQDWHQDRLKRQAKIEMNAHGNTKILAALETLRKAGYSL